MISIIFIIFFNDNFLFEIMYVYRVYNIESMIRRRFETISYVYR